MNEASFWEKKRERSKLDVNSKEMEKVICKGKLIGI